MTYEEIFKDISQRFTNNDFVIAGGSVYRAFNGQSPESNDSDIDVFLSDTCFQRRRSQTEYFMSAREGKSKGYTSKSYKYFDNKLKKIIEYVVFLDKDFDAKNIIKHFDLNCSRYYWNSKKEIIETSDPYPNEIVVMSLKEGETFQRVFERVSKYRQITPKPVVFRIQDGLVVTVTEEKKKPNPLMGY